MQFDANKLLFVWTPEGRVLNTNGALSYQYFIKDHLGNVRMSFDNGGLGGTAIPIQMDDYYPYGGQHPGQSLANIDKNNFLYQGKELDDMLKLYDFEARFYDPWLPYTNAADPHADRYSDMGTHSWLAGNPINNTDPTGKDVVFSVDRDKKGNITGVNISSTIHITGEGANEERANQLNQASSDVFKSRNINGVKVSFNINYKYSKDIKTKDLKQGDNILTFVNKLSTRDDRSHVSSRGYTVDKRVFLTNTSRTGELYKDDWDKTNSVFHETLHFTGLSDRYNEDEGIPMFGFENDIMGTASSKKIWI